jgi:hypothetical protein
LVPKPAHGLGDGFGQRLPLDPKTKVDGFLLDAHLGCAASQSLLKPAQLLVCEPNRHPNLYRPHLTWSIVFAYLLTWSMLSYTGCCHSERSYTQ